LIDVPPNYKNEPPKVKCITKHLHPNIQQTDGSVCLNLLRDDWLPSLSMEDVILGLLHLYVAPNPDDPLDHGTTLFLVGFFREKFPVLIPSVYRRCRADAQQPDGVRAPGAPLVRFVRIGIFYAILENECSVFLFFFLLVTVHDIYSYTQTHA
jgi:hypothetical protein